MRATDCAYPGPRARATRRRSPRPRRNCSAASEMVQSLHPPSARVATAMIKRAVPVLLVSLVLALVLPAVAPATLAELGVIGATTPPTVPSCPGSPCLAVSRTTGFQLKVGASYGFLAAPRKGSVVAWTIMLGKPNATQVKFFNANEGGEPEAGIAVLRPVPKPNLSYK